MDLTPNYNQPVINPSSPSDEPTTIPGEVAILPTPGPLSRDTATKTPSSTPTPLPSSLPPHSPRFRLTQAQRNDWAAARILNQNFIPACLAGSPVSALYGSDNLWVWVPVLVQDPFFEIACKILIENGYKDISMDEGDILEHFQPPEWNEDGTKAVSWRLFSITPPPNRFRIRKGLMKVMIIPSNHWHFDIKETTTIDVEGIRFPKFVSYQQALVSLLAQRSKSSTPAGYYLCQLLSIRNLHSKYPEEMKDLSPADKFFIQKYSTLHRLFNHVKLVELTEKLKTGEIGMEQAMEQLPVERKYLNRQRHLDPCQR